MDTSVRYPLQLTDVRLYEAHLTRPVGDGQNAPAEPGLPITIEVVVDRLPPNQVLAQLTLAFEGSDDPFDIRLVLEGLFESEGSLDDLDDEFWREFESVSAPMLIWPYARECVSTIAWRGRLDLPILPTLNRLAMIPVEDDGSAGPSNSGTDGTQ